MKRKCLITFCVFAMLLSTGCQTKKLKISTTVYPIQYLVDRISGGEIEVVNISESGLIQTTTVKENYENLLETSQALFYLSELEPYFDVYGDGIRKSEVDLVNLASKIVLYKFQRYTKTTVEGKGAIVEGAYYDNSVFNEMDLYKNDPFVWLDAISMISVAEVIRDYLIEQYPEGEKIFSKNFNELEYDLTMLDVEYQDLKTVATPISFVSLSASFGVWQKAYGIKVYPVCLSKYGALPSEEQLAYIKQKIQEDNVQYIVHEQNLSKEMEDLYLQLKEELGLTSVELSNISSLSNSEKKQNKDYLTIMYDNLIALEEMGK